MKKIIIIIISVTIATNSFGQIKTFSNVNRNKEAVYPNKTMIAVGVNADSVELQKLFEKYKAEDALANEAFNKLVAKVKSMQANNPNGNAGREMNMVQLQYMVASRGTMLQMITNMISKLNEGKKGIIQKID